jgi:hypothetical protein
VWGASATGTTGNNAKVEANVSIEAPVTDVATAPEVWVLERGFVFGWVVFYLGFKWCIKPAQGMDIICVDMASGEVAEKSSSYDLFIFSSGADPDGPEIVAIAFRGSSPSIGELWADIDNLDEIWREDTSVVYTCDVLVHSRKSIASAEKAGKHSRRKGNEALSRNAPESSNVKSIASCLLLPVQFLRVCGGHL